MLNRALFYVLSIILTLAYENSALAQSAHGVFRVVKGDIRILSAGSGKESKAKIGQKVQAKDVITAGKDSRAKIVMVDKNEINVSPDSRVEIANYEFKPNEDKKNVLLNVMYGKVRAKVNQKYDGDNSFQVRTPTAVAGVRGTDFFTSFDRTSSVTRVVTFEGRVAFGGIGAGGQILNPVMVDVGQTTTLARGSRPQAPVNMPKSELTQMNSETDANSTESTNPASNDSRQPAEEVKEEPKKEEPKKEEPKKEEPKRSADREAGRGPSAIPSGSMLRSDDIVSGTNVAPTVLPSLPAPPILQPPPQSLPNNNDFVREVIGNSRKTLNITVTPGGP